MERQRILKYLENIQTLRGKEVEDIVSLAERYPFSQTLQLLKVIGLKNNDDIEYKPQLNIASVYCGDRNLLYDYIVRDGLLKVIDNHESSNSIDDGREKELTKATSTASSDRPLPLPASANEPEPPSRAKEPENLPAQTPVIDPKPLEEEILREAIVHTSELEVNYSLHNENAYRLEDAVQVPAEEETDQQEEELSFSQWLLKKDSGTSYKQETVSQKPKKENSIIDSFIQNQPQISPIKAEFFSPVNMGKMSLVEDESFVTETLAKIYLKQGEYEKAAKAYKNLSLKYPEKKIYFANLLKEAEENKNKKTR